MTLKKIVGTGAIAGVLGLSAVGLAGAANAATAPGYYAVLDAVSCPKAGGCVAVGSYVSSAGKFEGLTTVEEVYRVVAM